jgi:hypothetical protein
MTELETVQQIRDVLRSFGCDSFEVYKHDATSTMVRGAAMYERPGNLDDCSPQLAAIVGGSVLLDPVYQAGCNSCDYGSQYGTDFLFRNATFIPKQSHSGKIR